MASTMPCSASAWAAPFPGRYEGSAATFWRGRPITYRLYSTALICSPAIYDAGMSTTELPRWDVSTYFPSLESREFTTAEERAGAEVQRLAALYDRHDVRGGARPLDADTPDSAAIAAFEEVLSETNRVSEEVDRLEAFTYSFVSTDTTNATAQSTLSRLMELAATLSDLFTRFDAWVAALGVDALSSHSADAAAHEWPLRKSALRAERQMPEGEEQLASLLSLTGSSAWSQLYSDVTSGIVATVDLPDGPSELPIFAIRGLAMDADPRIRQTAYQAELRAWEANAIPLSAAMNAIKGEQQRLATRRGWPSILDAQLFGQAVSRTALDAMQAAMVDSFGDFRSYLRTKAALLGDTDGLAFWSLFAPVGKQRTVTWDEAKATVDDAFTSYSPQLAGLAHRAFDNAWIDAGPRAGKQGGAFCMPMGDGDSRVLLNFNHSMPEVFTLAHELGHAYHNTTMTERTPIQRGTPSSLAETASIFCETILIEHGLSQLDDPAERLNLLDVDLQSSTQVIVDIHSRFLFEASVFEARARSTISTEGLCDLMTAAQEATYGNGLALDQRHPWMWAAKPHYYGSLFYNWPYAFGLLFGLGLYARYRDDPERFRSGYDELLSSTGLDRADALANRFGIDIEDRAFWESSLDVVRSRIREFQSLAEDQ